MRRLAALAAFFCLASSPTIVRGQQPDTRAGELVHGAWHGAVLGHEAAGGFLMLADGEGFVRMEIGREDAGDLTSLLARRGRGWTVVAAPDGGGTRNAWDHEWRALEPRLSVLLQAGAEILAAPPPGPFRQVRVVRDPHAAADLRSRLTSRGRGRGGPGETLVISGDAAGDLAFGSSRRPGILRLASLTRRPVDYPLREAFVPLWPLSEILAELPE